MLSRIADSLFWMARYMDRAENTARLLDVTYHMLLEQSHQMYELRWDAVIKITGGHRLFRDLYAEANEDTVGDFLIFCEQNPDSIMSCMVYVRENARSIRDQISREMWENVNGLYHRVRDMHRDTETRNQLHGFCREVISGSHAFNGITDSTLPHDEGWHFLQMGRALERAEHTTRVVDVEYHQLVAAPAAGSSMTPAHQQWMAVLKSVGAYEIYRRVYQSSIDPQNVAELLILHPQHPRSVRFNIASLQDSLQAISGASAHSYANEAERLTGKLHESLVYDRIQDIFSRGLHVFLSEAASTCRSIGDNVARTYFYYAGVA
jgi:uncharacterized alpha-E superfamily protein